MGATVPVVTGPAVLIVSVELVTPLTFTGWGLNEQIGGIATSGVIEAHDSVTPPAVPGGVMYPLMGLMLITPSPPLPAGTLLGATAVCTVIVNCGDTASTVKC